MNSKIMSVSYKGAIEHRGQSVGLLMKPGDFVIVKREIKRLLILRCPCGCGDDLLINLDPRSGDAWRLYKKASKFSLYPSYWRDTACGSHFIIWNNKIHWSSHDDEVVEYLETSEETESVVYEALPDDRFRHYFELADEISMVPWECLQVCKLLVRKGLAKRKGNYEFAKVEGTKKPRSN